MVCVSLNDLGTGHLQPYELWDPCGKMKESEDLLTDEKNHQADRIALIAQESALSAACACDAQKDKMASLESEIDKNKSALLTIDKQYKTYRDARAKPGLL